MGNYMQERNTKYDRLFFPQPELDERSYDQIVHDYLIYGCSKEEAHQLATKDFVEREKLHRAMRSEKPA